MLAYRFIELKKFGFNTFNGGSEYMYDIKDLREHPDMDSAFVKAFWGNLNSTRDDVLDIYEVKASYNIKETRQDIARMVCKHKIEWSYTKEEVSKEVTKFYDFLISKEDPGMKDALEGLVKQELDAIKVQVSKLMFWNEAAGLASPPPKEEKEESKVQISRGFRGHPELSIMRRDDKFSAEKDEADTLPDSSSSAPAPAAPDVAPASGDTKEENPKPPGLIFPQNPNVYHFHPIAFVNQMKLMFENSGVIKKGDKGEIVREINIRLAGFGGNIPTDLFTERTERMVSQFQKDYMGITPTGEISNKELDAIDEFSKKFDISDEFWNQMKCSCKTKGQRTTSNLLGVSETNKCDGFGDNKGKGIYREGKPKKERFHTYEYPGIHRSLLFAVKALQFYFSKQDVYKIDHVSSGYRCRFKGYMSTNHAGKAIDIQFSKGNWQIRQAYKKNLVPLRKIRDDFYVKCIGAQIKWPDSNMFSTEPVDLLYNSKGKPRYDHTYSWIHMDVRTFESQYLEDHFFCKDREALNKGSIKDIPSNVTQEKLVDKNYTIKDGKDAVKHIYDKYGKDMAEIIERMFRGETAHFKSGQYKKTGTGGMEAHGAAPYYGWSSDFFNTNPEYKPEGLVAFFEGKGLSAIGGNKQVTDKKKKFVVMPSVIAAMEYKVYYINKYNGDYARWHSTKESAKKTYRTELKKIIPRFVNEFEIEKNKK